ncbi:cytochrome p450 family protein [Colletotrichum plurivorum]|uniref:Cytochrome p450 family protein n=1 Tax=Colletotrichum plurivorum TaxID=2175906 RepID=A0A8H6KJM3_9PEZI|nr:cytochrome p450 family protein [Colletotrichum plurivorum]
MSQLPNLYYSWLGTKHLKVMELHKRYGDAVRIAPAFISIQTPNAVKALYETGSRFEKGMFYTRGPIKTQALISIASATEKHVHARKKRLISHAFSDAALRSYEGVLADKVGLLCRQLQDAGSFDGEFKNMSRWFSYLTYDVMGKLIFDREYNMLTGDDDHFILDVIDAFQHGQVILGTVPRIEQWGLAPLLFVKVMSSIMKFRKYVDGQVAQRIADEKAGNGSNDVFRLLLNHRDAVTGEHMDFKELSDEAVVLIIAASDTTATALAASSFCFARYPECYRKVQAEVRDAFPNPDDIKNGPRMMGCRYLRACVEEALRMCPVVPGHLPRETPVDALVDGHVVPAGAYVGVPGWSMHRHEAYFPDPTIFRPERWLEGTEDDLARLRSVHFPFIKGPRACIGKNLAYNTIYLTLSRIAHMYDIESRDPLPLEFHVKDHFAAGGEGRALFEVYPSRGSMKCAG